MKLRKYLIDEEIDLENLETVNSYLKLSRITAVGKFELKSKKPLLYKEILEELIQGEEMSRRLIEETEEEINPAIDLRIIVGDIGSVAFFWEVTEVNRNGISFKIEFSDPIQVS